MSTSCPMSVKQCVNGYETEYSRPNWFCVVYAMRYVQKWFKI